MAKEVKEEKIKKVSEKRYQLDKTKSNFYPHEYGGEEAAYKQCKHAALDKQVYWDKKNECWYYYL